MSRSRTLTNMLLDIRTRTNQENSTFVTDSELTEYLNQALAELWSRLVQGQSQPFYRASFSYTVTPSTMIQALPSDFFEVQEITITIGGVTGPIQPFMAGEHGWLQSMPAFAWNMPAQYRIQGNNIEFSPVNQNFTATLYYSPIQPRLVNGSDTFDGFNGFEIAAIYDVCAKVLAKEESDPSFYAGERDRIYRHIDSLAAQRDASNPERVQDVSGQGGWPGWSFGRWL